MFQNYSCVGVDQLVGISHCNAYEYEYDWRNFFGFCLQLHKSLFHLGKENLCNRIDHVFHVIYSPRCLVFFRHDKHIQVKSLWESLACYQEHLTVLEMTKDTFLVCES